MKVVSLPSVLHFMIRSLGWSVKKTLPWASAAGPSVNSNPPARTVSFAPGAMIGALGGRPAVLPRKIEAAKTARILDMVVLHGLGRFPGVPRANM